MPLLEDARALLEIDRERVRLARETAQIALEHSEVLADAEDRALRLSALGDRERPKAEQFVKRMTEAATIAPRPAGGIGAGGSGEPRTIGSGGGGGGAGGGGGGSSLLSGPRSLVSQRGGIRQSEDFVREHCALIPGGVEVPNPRNPFALAQGDMVKVPAWDCSTALGVPDAVFLDPDAMQALRQPAMSSNRAGGGGGGGRGRDPRFVIPERKTVFIGGEEPGFAGSTAQPPQGGPTADGKLVEKTLKDGFGALVKELRASGDLGLQVRRNGGL